MLSTALILFLCTIDRINLSVAILPMAQQFAWSPATCGLIQSSFLWGYTATQARPFGDKSFAVGPNCHRASDLGRRPG